MSVGDEVLDMFLQVKYQQPIRKTICLDCGYPLEDTERGLHCKNCGWLEMPQYKYVPRIPEKPSS